MNSFILLQATSPQPSEWAMFFGRFHPLIVHLPIGFLLIAGLLELDRVTRRQTVSSHTITLILFWSAVSATMACIFGYLLSLGGGYDEETLSDHMWEGIGVAVFAWIAWAIKHERIGPRIRFGPLLYFPALGIGVLLLLAAGHKGGSLTHGSDFLTQYTPEPLRSMAGIPPREDKEEAMKPIEDVNQAMVYQQIVHPILKSRCIQCHNPEKSKADLRLDSPEMIKKGSEDGPILVAGKGAESKMIKVCLLPEEDDHHMPPKGKTQLTENQVALLTWWINQGAPFDKKVAELKVPEDVKPALASLGTGAAVGGGQVATGPAPESPVLTMKLPAADPKAIDELKKAGLLVLPLSKEQNQLEVSAVNARAFNDGQAVSLPKLSQQIVWLKLGDTEVSDATLAQVAQLKNLQKLHLEQTKVTDAGLKNLKNLPYLEYLNLYGTEVTDAGLKELAGIKNLKTVYLWQTKVTEAGVAELKKALPNLEINMGLGESSIAAFTKADSAATEKPKAK
ncbi:c-type cytochrome domain-containing protein [Larkinella rosea]|uniref:Ribonuclease inhibitor n=1 Tax=Larkinella rosea TaxID=2025312 RepID=A0A3P1BTB4_9BACT|nr:c-type cytochrome domain-containing protein [Larkinella rosea]RRB04096.1 ribonuclease inhibitor [Larkinella rosea]